MTKVNKERVKKKRNLRHNEYYGFQDTLDNLYRKSVNGDKFNNLMTLIMDEQNIRLAYRNIKANKGSKTPGVDKRNIINIAENNMGKFIEIIQSKLKNYHPQKVRRKYIPKSNGKLRPLGIPTIEDRIIQQCIKQILEPIVEAKFYEHSYGFRPNRSSIHALSRVVSLININKLYYSVDIDIKSFFDNVNHGKLLKQLWSLGIQDKSLLKIISKILKSEIEGEGIPEKGTPQGGIISPLLANVCLNELDWWIASQFQKFPTKHKYADDRKKFRALKDSSNIKEVFIVRYADDFKILCRNYEDASKIFLATKKWLKERLGLEVSEEKSKITNLRRKCTEFLGFEIKAIKKHTKRGNYVAKSKVLRSKVTEMKKEVRKRYRDIQKEPTAKKVQNFNAMVLGWHNYFKYGTHSYFDFANISYGTRIYRYHCIIDPKRGAGTLGIGSKNLKTFQKYFGRTKQKLYNVMGLTLFPIETIKHKNPLNYTQEICDYTDNGRKLKHDKLKPDNLNMVLYLMRNADRNSSVELNDNRISVFTKQNGKCAITKQILKPGNMALHHIKPRSQGGTDKFQNLVYITDDVHKLIHATDENTILKYWSKILPNYEQVQKINDYRIKVGNLPLVNNHLGSSSTIN